MFFHRSLPILVPAIDCLSSGRVGDGSENLAGCAVEIGKFDDDPVVGSKYKSGGLPIAEDEDEL